MRESKAIQYFKTYHFCSPTHFYEHNENEAGHTCSEIVTA